MKSLLYFIPLVFLVGCTNTSDAERVLSSQGFTDIKYTGYDIFACSEDDFYHTGFTATSITGQHISGTVCSGLLFKGSTIRY